MKPEKQYASGGEPCNEARFAAGELQAVNDGSYSQHKKSTTTLAGLLPWAGVVLAAAAAAAATAGVLLVHRDPRLLGEAQGSAVTREWVDVTRVLGIDVQAKGPMPPASAHVVRVRTGN